MTGESEKKYSFENCPQREAGLVDGRRREVYGCALSGEIFDGNWRYQECCFRGEDYRKCLVFLNHNRNMIKERSEE